MPVLDEHTRYLSFGRDVVAQDVGGAAAGRNLPVMQCRRVLGRDS